MENYTKRTTHYESFFYRLTSGFNFGCCTLGIFKAGLGACFTNTIKDTWKKVYYYLCQHEKGG